MAKEKSTREKSTPKSGTPAGMREGMKKATTGMLVLFLLQQKPMYTYDIMRRVEEITKGALTNRQTVVYICHVSTKIFI